MSVTSGACDSPASSIQSAPQNRSQPRRWTAAEDKFLTQLVAKFGDKRGSNGHWKEIGSRFSARTAKDCRKRWFHSLDPSLRKGRWCQSEDRILLDAYNQLGPAWRDIALLLPGRKDDQCAKRYREILSPAVRNRLCEWTSEEDRLLIEGVRSFGHSWSTISARIPGRPPLTCRNRWRVVSKKSQAGVSKEGNSSQSTVDIATPVPVGPQSADDNATGSQSVELNSQSTASVANYEDPPNLEAEAESFLSSLSAAMDEDPGTNPTLGDMSHSFDSFLQELYESQSTSTMLADLSSTVALPEEPPGTAAISDQSFRESIPLDVQKSDHCRSAERRAELEAETTALRQDTGAGPIEAEDVARSAQSDTHSDWNLAQADSLEGDIETVSLTSSLGRVASTRSVVREIHHHHHHHYHHYHHHHHHYHS